MDKEQIRKLALEVWHKHPLTLSTSILAAEFAQEFLAAVRGQESKEAVAYMHYQDTRAITRNLEKVTDPSEWLPLFLHPQEEGWISVEDRLPEPFNRSLNRRKVQLDRPERTTYLYRSSLER